MDSVLKIKIKALKRSRLFGGQATNSLCAINAVREWKTENGKKQKQIKMTAMNVFCFQLWNNSNSSMEFCGTMRANDREKKRRKTFM